MHNIYHPDGDVPANYNFAEMCPECGRYIPVELDYDEFDHYQVECPVCGYKMMLCTLCYWDQELEDEFTGSYKCDWSKENGCYRKGH